MSNETASFRIEKAIAIAVQYGSIDGAHHKDWVIDQMIRALAGDRYDQMLQKLRQGRMGRIP